VAEDFETGRVRIESSIQAPELAVRPGSALRSEERGAAAGSYRPNSTCCCGRRRANATALARVATIDRLEALGVPARPIWGSSRNKEQHYAVDAPRRPHPLVTLMGRRAPERSSPRRRAEKAESESHHRP
jgi:hypothetical protein